MNSTLVTILCIALLAAYLIYQIKFPNDFKNPSKR